MARPRIVGLFTAPATLSKAQFVMQMEALADALLAVPVIQQNILNALDAQTRAFGLPTPPPTVLVTAEYQTWDHTAAVMGDATVVKLLGGAVAEFCGEVTPSPISTSDSDSRTSCALTPDGRVTILTESRWTCTCTGGAARSRCTLLDAPQALHPDAPQPPPPPLFSLLTLTLIPAVLVLILLLMRSGDKRGTPRASTVFPCTQPQPAPIYASKCDALQRIPLHISTSISPVLFLSPVLLTSIHISSSAQRQPTANPTPDANLSAFSEPLRDSESESDVRSRRARDSRTPVPPCPSPSRTPPVLPPAPLLSPNSLTAIATRPRHPLMLLCLRIRGTRAPHPLHAPSRPPSVPPSLQAHIPASLSLCTRIRTPPSLPPSASACTRTARAPSAPSCHRD
ncbi:hypothetical protein DFH09DRAFT_1374395 [Mycena vulgaris]|nr:hypothetical protein DFH09DRAFT_1374395 [Mycena vulgaris]